MRGGVRSLGEGQQAPGFWLQNSWNLPAGACVPPDPLPPLPPSSDGAAWPPPWLAGGEPPPPSSPPPSVPLPLSVPPPPLPPPSAEPELSDPDPPGPESPEEESLDPPDWSLLVEVEVVGVLVVASGAVFDEAGTVSSGTLAGSSFVLLSPPPQRGPGRRR
jgi:hypothetical protein